MRVNKKAQSLGGLYSGILVIASIGIMLALVLFILSSMGTSFLAKDTGVTVTNESGFYLNGTVYTVAGASATDFEDFAITTVNNASNGVVLTVGNYTAGSTGTIVNATTASTYAVNVSYTYTYSADTASSDATGTLVDQFVAFLPWLGIILLVLAAGVVLFFVIRSFSGNKGV